MPKKKKVRKASRAGGQYVGNEEGQGGIIPPHPIKKDVHYRMWNLFSGGLMFNSSGQVLVNEQQFDTSDSKIQTKDAGRRQFHLVFNDTTDQYITANSSGQDITLTTTPDKYAEFHVIHNGNYTLFRCNVRSDGANNVSMYLGSDDTKTRATLVQVNESYTRPAIYPDPRTLFIATTTI